MVSWHELQVLPGVQGHRRAKLGDVKGRIEYLEAVSVPESIVPESS
jgi:hypothetical protein